MSKSLKKKLIKSLLHHSAKTYVFIGIAAFILGYIGGYLAGKHKMKKKIRREKIVAGIKDRLNKQDEDYEE